MQQPKKDQGRTLREMRANQNAYARILAKAKAVVLHGEPPVEGVGECPKKKNRR